MMRQEVNADRGEEMCRKMKLEEVDEDKGNKR